MRDISFFSGDTYLSLPTANNPKVILAVSNSKMARNSFILYNPFSFKAKLLKSISAFLFVNFNGLMRVLLKTKSHQKSDFINYLEHKLNAEFSVSIYNATDKNKVVLQLLCENEVYGYLKFPLNHVGIKNIKNEEKAIALLSGKDIVAPTIFADIYKETPYFILSELKGTIDILFDNAIESLLNQFKKEEKYKLKEHQRITDLYANLEKLQLESYKPKVESILKKSTKHYFEVYEHGDFTPWNIVTTNKGLEPFDFEFFIEHGIEYFDLIKYHFQVGKLLKKKNPITLSDYIYDKIKVEEIKYLVALFLIKEIILLKQANESYQFHDAMLNHICD